MNTRGRPTIPTSSNRAEIKDPTVPETTSKTHPIQTTASHPISEIDDRRPISHKLSGEHVDDNIAEAPDRGIPGAISITPKTNVEDLSKQLAALPSWQLRYHALATRDAADFAEEEKIEQAHRLALDRIENEARKRGLDLDTGRLDPARAEDRKSFERHQDEYEPPINLEQPSREK